MYFLVDFENVHSEGLRGVEFLQKDDYLTLFYSKAANVCEQRYLKQILNSVVLLILANWLEPEKMV